ncbi:MAG TPA: hypothetical protein VGO57_10410 [Verrucomicrobiae bacterium]|jgi:hypothetical protein
MKIKFLMLALTMFSVAPFAQADLISLTNSTPVVIPDNDPAGAASGIYLSPENASGYVTDLSLTFTLAGNPAAWAGDYTLELIHIGEDNSSQSATLFTLLPYGNNGFDDVLVTSASGSLTGTSADYSATPITGTLGNVDLSTFQNISAAGEWVLQATDSQGLNQGALVDWTLTLDVVPEPGSIALAVWGGLMGLVALTRAGKI